MFQFGFGAITVRPPGVPFTATTVPQYLALTSPLTPLPTPPVGLPQAQPNIVVQAAPPPALLQVPLVGSPQAQPNPVALVGQPLAPPNLAVPGAQPPAAALPDYAPIINQINTQIQGQAAQMNNNMLIGTIESFNGCLLYTSPSPRD